ncbi:MAG: flagellar biosynthesis protein FlhA [Gammaproteobacteria bacterium]|nr:MAG: flagellar biosynthesis protein FlhA [Gammaproteobacteria bacterium]
MSYSAVMRNNTLSLKGLGIPVLLVAMLAMMVLPLPSIMLDLFFTFNIALSLVVLLVVIYTIRPLDFSVFPTVLLAATLLRLSLNVASTRVVLLDGHTGTGAAGNVIQSFGEFVVGGSYTVGIVVFAVLTIINFVVVTKGAGRISEVNARFTLDAMPGKQMAVDADLNSGLITQDEARERRQEISGEADFYGSMDGASKFIRGDAIAGILILFINLIFGLGIGMIQHDLEFSQAAEYYTLLTIGDGLVAQIPSLILSTAAAIAVTRASAAKDMGEQVIGQLFNKPKPIAITASIIFGLGLIPGMPHFVFLTLGLISGGIAYIVKQQNEAAIQVEKDEVVTPDEEPQFKDLSWDDVPTIDVIGLEVGYRLIPMVDKTQGGQMMSRIKGVRKKLSQELGFLIQAVHIRDNLELSPNGYRIILMGVPVGEGEVYSEKELAINPGQVFGEIKGIKTKDPTFGLEAVWIELNMRDEAQTLGYTVVDSSTVVATHMSHLLHNHAHELLGHEEVQHLLDMLAKQSPSLVEDLVPKLLPLGGVVKVLQNILAEGVPIRDMRTIAETLAEVAVDSQNSDVLTAAVRTALSRQIYQHINGLEEEMPVITLNPELEQILQQSIQSTPDKGLGIEPGMAEQMIKELNECVQKQEMDNKVAVLLVSPVIRSTLARMLRSLAPNLHVLSYNEVPDSKNIKVVAAIGGKSANAI